MKSKRDAYFLERRLLEFLSRIKYYPCSSYRDIYFMIKQEIKYNPDLKGIRFMSERKFYQALETGRLKAYHGKENKFVDLYYAVENLKQQFIYACRQKLFDTLINSNSYSYCTLRYLDYYDTTTIKNKKG